MKDKTWEEIMDAQDAKEKAKPKQKVLGK